MHANQTGNAMSAYCVTCGDPIFVTSYRGDTAPKECKDCRHDRPASCTFEMGHLPCVREYGHDGPHEGVV